MREPIQSMPEIIGPNGNRVCFAASGHGPVAVFFLPCLGGTSTSWHEVWQNLDPSRYRCVGLDYPGHSERLREVGDFTNQSIARDVIHLVDALKINSFFVVGHSMGGKIGMYLAAREPSRVRGLILLGSPSPGLVPFFERAMVEDFIAHLSVPWLREFYRPWFKEPPGDTADIYFKTFAMVPAWALRAACELALFTDMSREVGTLALPALIVQGTHDPFYGPAYQAKEVLPVLPNAKVATIDCGHGLILEEPREIATHIDRFLTNLEGCGDAR